MRRHRASLRFESEERAADVERVMREQNVPRATAQWVAASSRHLRTAIATRGGAS